jgi:hypothetical protein
MKQYALHGGEVVMVGAKSKSKSRDEKKWRVCQTRTDFVSYSMKCSRHSHSGGSEKTFRGGAAMLATDDCHNELKPRCEEATRFPLAAACMKFSGNVHRVNSSSGGVSNASPVLGLTAQYC